MKTKFLGRFLASLLTVLMAARAAADGEVLSGAFNDASGDHSVIAGGYKNTVDGSASAVLGGNMNTVSGGHSVIGGGWYNTAAGEASVIGGGWHNTATDQRTVVSGGGGNKALGGFAAVGGGRHNYASGYAATVVGGGADNEIKTNGNMASGNYSAVVGGHDNTASGVHSIAMGRKARVNHDQAVVIGLQASDSATCESQGDNTMNVCADNGIYFNGVELDVKALLDQIAELQQAVAALQQGKGDPAKFTTTAACNFWQCATTTVPAKPGGKRV